MGICWDETYSVHVESIDAQHKRLFDLLDRLLKAVETHKDKREFALLLGEFVYYVHDHFMTEETYMRSIGYPDIESHIRLHEEVRKKVEEFTEAYNAGNAMVTYNLAGFITKWIQQHILIDDQKYAAFQEHKE